MILKELNLIGFGKFENKKLELEKGINLIYGENESGKSTIHSFIDGIFYGFLRPNVRSALYLDEHKKYDPWNSNRYGGILRFKQEEKEYRIEREFTKGKENTKVLNEANGIDITKSIDTGRGRILQPGLHFFGFNTRVYSNTISIKQLATETDDKLGDEVRERLINVSTAMDDEISVENSISELKSSMEEIGTERAHTKPYARNINKIEELKKERENILLKKGDYESFLEDKGKLLENLFMEEEKQKRIGNDLIKAKVIKKKKILKEAKELSEEIKNIESHISQPSSYEKFIKEDYNKYEELEENKNKISYNKKDNNLEFLKRDYKFSNAEKRKSIILLSLGILSMLTSLILRQIVLGIPLILFVIYFIAKLMKLEKTIGKLNSEIQKIEKEENRRNFQVQEIEKLQRELLSKYEVENKIEFNGLVSRIHMEGFNRERFIREVSAKESLLKRILDNNTIEDLEEELKESNIDINEILNEDELSYLMEKSKDEIVDMKLELNGIETNLNILEKEVSKLVVIEEDIYKKEEYKEELDNKLKSLNLAIDTIEELSKDIHSQFAPAINKKISGIVDKITNGKYNKVRVSEELDISVENPATKEIININSLSGGTMDQLYFALRFVIINSMVEDRLPLILDDCFIQYDDSRLENIIKLLSDIGKERQIILFTCHNREKRIMEEIGVNFNFLNLT